MPEDPKKQQLKRPGQVTPTQAFNTLFQGGTSKRPVQKPVANTVNRPAQANTTGKKPVVAVKPVKDIPDYKDKKQTDYLWKKNTYFHSRQLGMGPVESWTDIDTAGYLADRQMLIEHGSPDIKEGVHPIAKRSYYNDGSNTMYLQSSGNMIPELAHAEQRRTGPIKRRFVESYLKDPFFSVEGQKRQYHNEGSLEHEAHSVIEPRLRAERDSIYEVINSEHYWDPEAGTDWTGFTPYKQHKLTRQTLPKRNGGKLRKVF